MSNHTSTPGETRRVVERHCDVLVVGGSAAGLAAALQLVRQRRSVIIVDAGEPRNAPAEHMHAYLGYDGAPPADLTAAGRAEVRRYGGEVLDGRVLEVTQTDEGRFRAQLTGGHAVVARHVLIATGLVDELPDVEGLAEHWGRGVIHCPFCHGYEVRDQTLVQIVTHPLGLHPAALFHHLTDRLTIVVHGSVDLDPSELEPFRAAGVNVVFDQVSRVVTGPGGEVTGVELESGDPLEAEAVVVSPRFRVRAEPFEALRLEFGSHPAGFGEFVKTDETGETSAPGVWAAGNVANPGDQVLQAAATGSRVGSRISSRLAQDDLQLDRPRSGAETDWDRRYSGERLWSGNPNGALVAEVDGLAAGSALDVGAGEGGDAVWLAERGWAVTANDISAAALARIAAEAEHRGLEIEGLHADANAPRAFGTERFDLVSAHYAAIPRTADSRALHNLLNAVAPGGTLLMVSHDLGPRHAPIDTDDNSRAFDPFAYLRVDDVKEAIAADPAWVVEVDETRPRPAGSASAGHHADDVVFRARRNEE